MPSTVETRKITDVSVGACVGGGAAVAVERIALGVDVGIAVATSEAFVDAEVEVDCATGIVGVAHAVRSSRKTMMNFFMVGNYNER